MRKRLASVLSFCLACGMSGTVAAQQHEKLDEYTLDTMVVEAGREKNKFGDIVTEQSYYRTGGDVDVITSEDIAQRHYVDMTSAIKTLPGVQVNSIGYHGGGVWRWHPVQYDGDDQRG